MKQSGTVKNITIKFIYEAGSLWSFFSVLKTLISNVVRPTRFSNNLNRDAQSHNMWKPNNLQVLGKPECLNRI